MQWPKHSGHCKQPDTTGELGESKGHRAEIIQQVAGEGGRELPKEMSQLPCQGKLEPAQALSPVS